jgi:hypothetical protein
LQALFLDHLLDHRSFLSSRDQYTTYVAG